MKNRLNPYLGTFVVIAMTQTAAKAANGTWDGSQNTGTWSDLLNWSALPGTGDTATFDNAGGSVDTIDLGAGVSIGGIFFDTSSVAAYTIGSGTAGSQALTLNHGGSITASGTINANQIFNAKLVLGTDATPQSYYITNNDTSNTLTFAGGITGGTGGTAGAKTLNISAAAVTNGGIILSGAITNGGATSLALNFTSISASLTDIVLSGGAGNTYTGGTSIGDKVRLNVSTASSLNNTAGLITVSSGGMLWLNSTNTVANHLNISGNGGGASGAGAIRMGNGTNIINGNITLSGNSTIGVDSGRSASITGDISGGFNLDKVSTGTTTSSILTFSGKNTYSGTTTITQGVISFGKKQSLYDSDTTNWTPTKISVASGAALALGVGDSAGYWDASAVGNFLGASQMGASTTLTGFKTGSLIGFDTTNATSGTFTYGAIGNIGTSTANGVAKLGTGTLVLNATNTYTGATAVEGGTLSLASTGVINGTSLSINPGGTFSNAGGTATFSGAATFGSGNTTFSQSSGTSSFASLDTSSTADFGLINVTGGTITVTNSLTLRRTSAGAAPVLAAPTAAPTTSGLYVNGSSAVVSLGTLNIGTANSSASARVDAGSVTVAGAVTVGKTTSTTRYDILQVNGGTFTAADTTNGIILAPNNGTNINNAELYLSGGTTTAGRIGFGASTDTVGGNGFLILGGGTLYVGSGGIVKASTIGAYNYTVGLTSGTIGAAANWSSSLNMTLGTNPTIQAADSSGVARNITLSGILSGSGFTKTGGGNLTLAGNTTNSYTGAAVLGAGSLILDNTTAAGGNNNTRLVDTSTLNLNGGNLLYKGADAASTNSTETIGAITSGVGGVITVTHGGTNLATLTGASFIHTAGQASVLINGTNLGKNSTDSASVGKVILTSAPTLTGTTAALTSGINSTVKNTRIVPYFVGEATFATGGFGTQTGTANTFLTYIAGSGLRPLNPTDEFTNNAITTGNNTYITSATSATTTVAINSLVINGADLSINDGQTLTDTSGALLFASSNAIKPTATSGALTFASGTEGQIYVNSGVTGTISAAITATGANALTKSGAGTLTLSGANTYTGTTTIRQGKLLNGSATTFSSKGALSMAGSGIFDLGGFDAAFTNVLASATTNLITNNGASNATLTESLQTSTISSIIADGSRTLGFKLINNNSSTTPFLITNTNTFSGGLTLAYDATNAPIGTRLRISSSFSGTPFGTGTITVGLAATDKAQILLDTVNSITLANDIIINTARGTDTTMPAGIRVDTASNIISGKITANLANAKFSVKTGASVSLTGQITGSSGLDIYPGTTGYLGTVTLNNAGTANNYAGDTTVGTSTYNSVLALGAANQIPNGSGKGNVIVNGTLNLGGFSETINGLSGGSTGTVDGVSGTPTLTVGDNGATGASNTFDGVIKNSAGTLSLTKVGNGTLTLSGTNTYTGETKVDEGKLVVNGSISTSLSTTVASGATLAGSGTMGAATISGILAPGNSIGTITATGDVTWNDNDAWVFELGSAASTLALAGSGSSIQDMLNMTGIGSDFLKGTGTSFTFDFANTGAVGFYKLVDWAGTSNFSAGDFLATNLSSGLTATFTVDAGTSALYLNVVPEPGAATMVGSLGVLALLRRRRK